MEFSQNNQQFRTLDLVILLFLVGGVASAISSVIRHSTQDDLVSRAQSVSESYARQIENQRNASLSQSVQGGRGPASVSPSAPLLTEGEMGRDPWGKPYNYRVQSGAQDGKTLILVWSNGPNHVSESDPAKVQTQPTGYGAHSELGFVGDDVGFVFEAQNHH